MTAAATLAALGDPTRRAIFERLAQAPAAVGQLASGLPVSRPAVSQHLKVLKSAGLVSELSQGARRIYRVDPRGLGALRDWLDGYLGAALESFQAYADAVEAAAAEQEDDQPPEAKPR
jgi:DNA-binding transcriptional ArsR family regulator